MTVLSSGDVSAIGFPNLLRAEKPIGVKKLSETGQSRLKPY